MGFVPAQIYDQDAVANLLYRSPKWARDLLSVTGDPPALSVFPRTRRPFLELELVGRDRELTELRACKGDLLLLGQPGSGKTFLLHVLAREGWGLFVASRDVAAILNAWREQHPPRLIVDDAHASLELLNELRQARRSTTADFAIVATSWPGEVEAVKAAMGGTLLANHVRQMELLTRKEILEIYERVGVVAETEVLRWLVDQAGNKPGLAVTLGLLFLQGDWERIRNAEALKNDIVLRLSELLGRSVREVLGAFSVGGDAGMRLVDVAGLLGLSLTEARSIAVGLGAGGVISDVGGDRLAVWPRPLRFALLRSVFFSGGYSLPYGDAFDEATDPRAAVEALATAALLGAAVPTAELRRRVAAHGSSDSWQALARRSPADCRWVLMEWRRPIVEIAPALLEMATEETVLRLLREIEGEVSASPVRRREPFLVLEQWAQDLQDWPRAVDRRRVLVFQVARYREAGGSRAIAAEAAVVAFSPTMEGVGLDPVGDRAFQRWALLPVEALDKIAELWAVVRPLFRELDAQSWTLLKDLLWSWLHPKYAARGDDASGRQREVMVAFSRGVLADLSESAQFGVGVGRALRRLAARVDLALPSESDSIYDILFPEAPDNQDAFQLDTWEANSRTGIENLAASWQSRRPENVAEDLRHFEDEARGVDQRPRQTPWLASSIARRVGDPRVWAQSFLAAGLPGDLVEPFLAKSVKERAPGWRPLLAKALRQTSTSDAALSLALLEQLPRIFDLQVMERVRYALPVVERMSLRGELPEWRMAVLLEVDHWPVALAAAVGEWLADPRGEVRSSLVDAWRRAVLHSRSREYGGEARQTEQLQYWLGEILGCDSDLAFGWLRERLQDPDLPVVGDKRGPFAKAFGVLDSAKRRALIPLLHPGRQLISLLPLLVGQDAAVYTEVLRRADLAEYHLHPLRGGPNRMWCALAKVALDSGYSGEDVAEASFRPPNLWWFDMTGYWEKWQADLGELDTTCDPRLGEVAEHGRRFAEDRILEGQLLKRQRELGQG